VKLSNYQRNIIVTLENVVLLRYVEIYDQRTLIFQIEKIFIVYNFQTIKRERGCHGSGKVKVKTNAFDILNPVEDI
jgi:hypothetical protein